MSREVCPRCWGNCSQRGERAFEAEQCTSQIPMEWKRWMILTEVQLHNPQNALRPGMYLQVRFDFVREIDPIVIPTAALTIRTGGPRVAVLVGQQRVEYRSVELGRDYGADIEIISGLKEGESVVVHPGDDLPEGTQVEPV